MIAILFFCSVVQKYYREEPIYYYDETNGFWHSITHAVSKVFKSAGKAVGSVAKAVGKGVSSAGKFVGKIPSEVGKFISYTKVVGSNTPIKISSLAKYRTSHSYTSSDDNAIVKSIHNDFTFDTTSISNFMKLSKLSTHSKRLFNNFGMDISKSDGRYRYSNLYAALIDVTRTNGHATVKVNEVRGSCTIYADFKRTVTHSHFGGLSRSSSTSTKWRPLTPTELSTVFTTVQNYVQKDIDSLL